MTCCPRCERKDTCMNSTVFMLKEDNATVKQALAFKELARRLNQSTEFVIDNFDKICEITAWTNREEYVYP